MKLRNTAHSPNTTALTLLAGLAIAAASASQADIPSWRSTNNGIYDAPNPPVDWEKDLLFEIPLDTKSNGTPILVDDKLFFTAEPALLICADRKTGKVLWTRSNDLMELNDISDAKRKELKTRLESIAAIQKRIQRLRTDVRRLERALEKDEGNQVSKKSLQQKRRESEELNKEINSLRSDATFREYITPPSHNTNGYTSYTPYSDGTHIYATFGLGVVVVYDLEGNRIWSKFVEHPDHNWGGATMPQIVDGKLIIRFDDYHALNPTTGKILWSTPSEVVFGTPTPFQVEGQHFLFTARGEVIRVSDGEVIQDGLVFLHASRDWSIFNTPTLIGDVLYTVSGVEGDNGDAYAYRIPKFLDTLEKSGLELVWHTQVNKDRYYSSVLIHEGLMYIVTRDNEMTTLDAATGEIIYTHKIKGARGTAYPSMVFAGGNIYLGSDDGTQVVLKPGREFQEIARNNLGPYRSTPIFTGDVAYLRTYESLQAAGKL